MTANKHRPAALGGSGAATPSTRPGSQIDGDVRSTLPRQRAPLPLLPSVDSAATRPLAALATADDVDRVIEYFAKTGRLFSADDVRGKAGEPLITPNQFAARFSVAKRRGVVEEIAASPSSRRLRRSGLRRIWVGSPTWRFEQTEEAS